MTNREKRLMGISRGTSRRLLQYPTVETRKCSYRFYCRNTAVVGEYCEACAAEQKHEQIRNRVAKIRSLALTSPACIRPRLCWLCQRSNLFPALDCPLPENHAVRAKGAEP